MVISVEVICIELAGELVLGHMHESSHRVLGPADGPTPGPYYPMKQVIALVVPVRGKRRAVDTAVGIAVEQQEQVVVGFCQWPSEVTH